MPLVFIADFCHGKKRNLDNMGEDTILSSWYDNVEFRALNGRQASGKAGRLGDTAIITRNIANRTDTIYYVGKGISVKLQEGGKL